MVCPGGFHASDRYTEAGTFRARHSQLPSLDIKCDRVSLFSLSGLGLSRLISPERIDAGNSVIAREAKQSRRLLFLFN